LLRVTMLNFYMVFLFVLLTTMLDDSLMNSTLPIRVYQLTGLTVSVQNRINVAPYVRELDVCINMTKFVEV
jgi:hypothetical protein